MLRCFLEVNILLEAHLCDFHQGYGYGHGCGTGDGYSQRRVQFCSDSHSVECQVDWTSLWHWQFLFVSSLFGASTFNMLLYLCLYYNSIQALFCFALFFRFFVCFSSASANYRIQLIYLLAILDSSFARGAKQRVCSLNIALMDRRSFDGLCEAGLGSIGLECVHLSRHHHYEHLGWISDLWHLALFLPYAVPFCPALQPISICS